MAASGSAGGRVDRLRLREFLRDLETRLDAPAELLLAGESSLVLEGSREWTSRIVYAARSADPSRLERTIQRLAGEGGIDIENESPADVVPLPAGSEGRARPTDAWRLPGRTDPMPPGRLRVFHFDPYSVAFRLIARGEEPDYHVVLAFLELGWISLDDMDRLLGELLPRFSSRTIQQDPAEFRRKYKGLRQMWRARSRVVS